MLSETVRQFYEEGGRHLFLDNVHRYGSWVQAIECLHDDYPDMQIVFAAPLLVEGEKTEMPFDGKGDWYTLHTMSFREYLSYEGALDLKPVPLDELLLNHAEVTQQVMDEVNIVPIFGNYLEQTGTVTKIDPVFRKLTLRFDGMERTIPFDDLDEIFGDGIVDIDVYLGIEGAEEG